MLDKVYIINTRDFALSMSLPVEEGVAQQIASYLVGKEISGYLLCRHGFPTYVLASCSYYHLTREIRDWLNGEVVTTIRRVQMGKNRAIEDLRDLVMSRSGYFNLDDDEKQTVKIIAEFLLMPDDALNTLIHAHEIGYAVYTRRDTP